MMSHPFESSQTQTQASVQTSAPVTGPTPGPASEIPSTPYGQKTWHNPYTGQETPLDEITNQDFLAAIFRNSFYHVPVTGFDDDPSAIAPERRGICWSVKRWEQAGPEVSSRINQYFCLSIFRSTARRDRARVFGSISRRSRRVLRPVRSAAASSQSKAPGNSSSSSTTSRRSAKLPGSRWKRTGTASLSRTMAQKPSQSISHRRHRWIWS